MIATIDAGLVHGNRRELSVERAEGAWIILSIREVRSVTVTTLSVEVKVDALAEALAKADPYIIESILKQSQSVNRNSQQRRDTHGK